MPSPSRVLFVCRGNRFRSALTEALFRRIVEQDSALAGHGLELRSAGPDAKKGLPASDIAFRHARGLGLNLESHRATPLADAVGWPDLAVCMERVQSDLVHQLRPDLPVHLLPWFATGDPDQEVFDPLPPGTPEPWPPGTEEAFTRSLEEIQKLLPSLAVWLKKEAAS